MIVLFVIRCIVIKNVYWSKYVQMMLFRWKVFSWKWIMFHYLIADITDGSLTSLNDYGPDSKQCSKFTHLDAFNFIFGLVLLVFHEIPFHFLLNSNTESLLLFFLLYTFKRKKFFDFRHENSLQCCCFFSP